MMSVDDLDLPEVYRFQQRTFQLVLRWAWMHDRWPVKWSLYTDRQALRLSSID